MSDNNFLYQINWNKEKYPEVCEELERAKKRTGGIAWYLRELIERDINEKRYGITKPVPSSYQDWRQTSQVEEVESMERKEAAKKIEDELPDDSGGFL